MGEGVGGVGGSGAGRGGRSGGASADVHMGPRPQERLGRRCLQSTPEDWLVWLRQRRNPIRQGDVDDSRG